jgi:hypothetical protein
MGRRVDYDPPTYRPIQPSEEIVHILESEFSDRFVEGMRARMVVSYFKYGPVADGYPGRVDALASLETRLRRYRETGNAEWLMDVANFAMIEFMHPRHPEAYFRPTDSDESPGRTRLDGAEPHDANRLMDTSLEAMRQKYTRPGD